MDPNGRVAWRPFVPHWKKRIEWWWWWLWWYMTALGMWVLDDRLAWRPFVPHWKKRIEWWWWWLWWYMTALGMWVLDDRHQTSTWSSFTFRHSFYDGTNISIPERNKSVSRVFRKVTACFTSTSYANHLPVKCFMSGQQIWKSLGAVQGQDWREVDP